MGKIDLYEARKAELLKLGRKSRIRGKAITEAWLAAHPGISRGECNTPEMRALREEIRQEYGQILEKYERLFKEQEKQ